MEEEQRLLVLLRLGQADCLRFSATSRAAAASLAAALEALTLDAPQGAAGSGPGARRDWPAVCRFLRRHPRLRRLSLRGTRLRAEDLEALLAAAPLVVECDVSFALPLSWPTYNALRQRSDLKHVDFRDTLAAQPNPDLSPLEVVVAQAYGLHCGRVDVCFRFASPSNKAMTGPLERFTRFFEGSSRYSAMLGCESFHVAAADVAPTARKVDFLVTFRGKGGGLEHSYAWELSKQTAPEEAAGCWMTDGVIPIDIESMWDGSMAEE
mmetsp:Transcript_7567/g.21267  ORF Transcript_7567/g.21267 Transcript_7567/m.21267 type:complete len:266 (+) Transcript_7567:119-916(+)